MPFRPVSREQVELLGVDVDPDEADLIVPHSQIMGLLESWRAYCTVLGKAIGSYAPQREATITGDILAALGDLEVYSRDERYHDAYYADQNESYALYAFLYSLFTGNFKTPEAADAAEVVVFDYPDGEACSAVVSTAALHNILERPIASGDVPEWLQDNKGLVLKVSEPADLSDIEDAEMYTGPRIPGEPGTHRFEQYARVWPYLTRAALHGVEVTPDTF